MAAVVEPIVRREAEAVLDLLRGTVIDGRGGMPRARERDCRKAFLRSKRAIRGTRAYREDPLVLPDEWDEDAVLELFPDDVPACREEREIVDGQRFSNSYREDVENIIVQLEGDASFGNEMLLAAFGLLDQCYYLVLDYQLMSHYEELRGGENRRRLKHARATSAGLRRMGAGGQFAIDEVVGEAAEDLEAALGALDDAVWLRRFGGLDRGSKKPQMTQLPCYDALACDLSAMMAECAVARTKRAAIIDKTLLRYFRDWYGQGSQPERVQRWLRMRRQAGPSQPF